MRKAKIHSHGGGMRCEVDTDSPEDADACMQDLAQQAMELTTEHPDHRGKWQTRTTRIENPDGTTTVRVMTRTLGRAGRAAGAADKVAEALHRRFTEGRAVGGKPTSATREREERRRKNGEHDSEGLQSPSNPNKPEKP